MNDVGNKFLVDPNFSILTKLNQHNEFDHILEELSGTTFENKKNKIMKRTIGTVDLEKIGSNELLELISTEFHSGMKEKLATVNQQLETAYKCETNDEELEFTLNIAKAVEEKYNEHIGKEERLLFPLISIKRKKQNEKEEKDVAEFIAELEEEHKWLKKQIQLIRKATHNYQCAIDSFPSHKLAYAHLNNLEQDFNRVFFVEEEYLFPRLLRIHHK